MTMTQTIPAAPRWDLESIFPGGSSSPQFKQHRQKTAATLEQLEGRLDDIRKPVTDVSLDNWVSFILDLESLAEDIEVVLSFGGCLTAQNVEDTLADAITSEGTEYSSRWQKLSAVLEAEAVRQTDDQWKLLLGDKRLAGIEYYLNERRDWAKSKMSVEMESLALDLSVNGYHSWNQLYDKMAGELKIEFSDNGKSSMLSMGQLATKMSDPRRDIRRQAFEKLNESWRTRTDLAAMALNFQAGYRLTLYRNRKWDSPLYEPLKLARMQESTLDAMWSAVGKSMPKLQKYVDAKKKLLGIDKFSWYDQFAPCGTVDKLYSFEEAGDFIVENMARFSHDMADFARMALDKRWVEAEDRPGKRGGGFCTGLGSFKQSRIFMTYAGTYENLLTLAHELGHAYHSWVLNEKPVYATFYPMNLAETASTFAEAIVTDAALANSSDPQERLMLIEQKLQGAYTMFTDIRSRFLFDKAFYGKRKSGMLNKEELSELMVNAQKEAFGPLLDPSGYHPLFWCTKLHFYITDAPFYNFPYAFGFLFSAGVYARAKKEGSSFADKYRALLADTGSMSTEDVAKKHLGADLSKEQFWNEAVESTLVDVDEFVRLAAKG
jgi:pepF/M3 family oligoendopeptidase